MHKKEDSLIRLEQRHIPYQLPTNRIYYGPPGTGKTYELSKLLKREYEQAITTVSAEEWRSQFIADRKAAASRSATPADQAVH